MKMSTVTLALVVLTLTVVGAVVASYLMTAPMSPDVDVNPSPTPTAAPVQATLSQVTVSSLSITVGDTLTLTTTVSDGAPGLTVTFYNQNGNVVGSINTDSTGVASLTIIPPEGTWSFYATATHP